MVHQRRAFTLSEVLLVLSVIGVVAALTIPTLQQSIGDAQYKTAYKKAYSVVSQAWNRAASSGLISSRTGWTDSNANRANFNVFKTSFNVIRDCNSNNGLNCWANNPNDKWYGLDATDAHLSFIDSSGMSWREDRFGAATITQGGIYVDTNGLKSPNVFGKDRFFFAPIVSPDQTNVSTDIAGVPIRVIIKPDNTTVTSDCPSGTCYYTSWITGAK